MVHSAIDDSAETAHFGRAPETEDQQDDLGWYNGPREGHWSVSSSPGSAIDDRCPTVWQLGPDRTTTEKAGQADALNGPTLRRLTRAAAEQKRAVEAEVEELRADVTDIEQKQSSKHSDSTKQPKAFYVPRLNDMRKVKDYDHIGRSGTRDVQRVVGQKKSAKKQPKKAKIPSPESSLGGVKTPSSSTMNEPRLVRILGKDGQEAFMEIPRLPQSSRQPSVAAPTSSSEDYKDSRRTEAAQRAAEIMMSGMRPQSNKESKHKTRATMEDSKSNSKAESAGGITRDRSATLEHQFWSSSPSQKSSERAGATSKPPSTKDKGDRLATIYAGKGWISPHPLSIEPSRRNSPPQSRISIPDDVSKSGKEMTYAEWKAIQEELVEIDSIPSSSVNQIPTSAAASTTNYHKATAASDSASKRSTSHRSSRHVSASASHRSQPPLDGPLSDYRALVAEAADAGRAYERNLREIIAKYQPSRGGSGASKSDRGKSDRGWSRISADVEGMSLDGKHAPPSDHGSGSHSSQQGSTSSKGLYDMIVRGERWSKRRIREELI